MRYLKLGQWMVQFTDNSSLLREAEEFLKSRAFSLINDVLVCLSPTIWPDQLMPIGKLQKEEGLGRLTGVIDSIEAPQIVGEQLHFNLQIALFPPLLACSTFLEMMVGLHAGDLNNTPSTGQIVEYARLFMDGKYLWLSEQLRQLYRNKIAHISRPAPVSKTKKPCIVREEGLRIPENSLVSWHIHIADSHLHGKWERASGGRLRSWPHWEVPVDWILHVSIFQLMIDSVNSVYSDKGYLAALRSPERHKLRDNFTKAMKDLYIPASSKS